MVGRTYCCAKRLKVSKCLPFKLKAKLDYPQGCHPISTSRECQLVSGQYNCLSQVSLSKKQQMNNDHMMFVPSSL